MCDYTNRLDGFICLQFFPIDPCALVDCAVGFKCKVNRTTSRAFCEPLCPKNLACALPQCKEGEVIEIPPGQCCPVCTRPDCAAVLCLALTEEDCEEGETLVTPPGECCARCMQDCSTVACQRPLCDEGEVIEVPEGQCCPVCAGECN